MGWALPKGNCGGERDPAPWKVTYTGERSNEPEESPDAEKSVAVSKLEYGKTHQEPNGPSELRAQSPKIETPGWGLGTETSAPEVSPWERAGGAGRSGDCLGGLETGLSSLTGQRLPGRLESRASQGEEAIR